MTTIVVVKKANTVVIGADSLTTFGDTRLSAAYEPTEKIFKAGDSFVGIAGSAAHHRVFQSALTQTKGVKLHSSEQIFETLKKLHPKLKKDFFLNPKEDDDDPYESSQLTALIANPSGIYGIYSYREVYDYERFWAIGSGRNYALGAMHAAYERCNNAKEIAEAGVAAGIEFDTSSAAPMVFYTAKLRK